VTVKYIYTNLPLALHFELYIAYNQ